MRRDFTTFFISNHAPKCVVRLNLLYFFFIFILFQITLKYASCVKLFITFTLSFLKKIDRKTLQLIKRHLFQHLLKVVVLSSRLSTNDNISEKRKRKKVSKLSLIGRKCFVNWHKLVNKC